MSNKNSIKVLCQECGNSVICKLDVLNIDNYEDIKNKIIEKLIKKSEPKDIIPIKSLGTAVRRLISRYFAGKRQEMDLKVDRSLAYDLSRIEFWEEKIRKLDNLDALLEEKLGEFQLTISQAYEFYKIIGDEDRKSLNFNKEN